MTDKTSTAERDKALDEFGFYLEERSSVWVVVDDCGGVRPASLNERVLWQAQQARASLPLPGAQDALEPLPAAVPVAQDEWKVRGYLAATLKCWHRLTGEEATELVAMTQRLAGLYAAPQPALSAGWVSVDERLPEPNVEVLCAGRGWGNSFVTACYYDDERREWYPINTHWTDATGCAQYPTHWMPLPPSPSKDGESNG